MLKFLTIKKIFLEFHENARSSNKILNDKEISNKKKYLIFHQMPYDIY